MVEFHFLGFKPYQISLIGGTMKRIRATGGNHFKKIIVAVGLILAFTQCVYAVNLNSVIGYWSTLDDKTQQTSSIIQVWQDPKNKMYYGKIYKIFPEGEHKVTDLCKECNGDLKNKPILGLQIIRHMVYRDGKYHDGFILDPRDGKEYHATMRLVDGGQKLKLRGYIGLPLFGKTTEWNRATEAQLKQ
jgi:uncharacterized protein (DUF2147 family)